ncbi:hypothetical protein CN639_23970 [Bacillus toyonensis]|uniref:ATP-dependent nuclease n=1 Tax=Bacillus toyonensis TaxID=155322 RepID=UPI000BF173CE|nr:AAA family ATPase [Bacillus toyonensis]MCU5395975.1 AAA family ATPase [Bacillus toyonensis]PEM82911.1 hypothetical protein CN639_23970 [Bacillus toyonensis]
MKKTEYIFKIQLNALLNSWGLISTVNYLDENGAIIYVDSKGEIVEDNKVQEFNIDRDGTNLRRMVQILYVPAQRNSIKEIQFDTDTLLQKILSFANKTSIEEGSIQAIANQLNSKVLNSNLIKNIQNKIDEKWNNLNPDPIIRHATLKFTGNDYDSILSQTGIGFSKDKEGNQINISQMGDGLQSIFYISLVQVLLDLIREQNVKYSEGSTNAEGLVILAIEEPENHVAPNIVGSLVKGLVKLSKGDGVQVIISTHSPSLLKRIPPQSIRLFRRGKNTVHKILSWLGDEEDHKFLKGAVQRHPELYYSNLVILVEGESEEVILPPILEEYDLEVDTFGISIVSLGGAHVNHMWRLLNDLSIPYLTLLDLDRERSGGGWEKINNIIEKISLYKPEIKEDGDLTFYYCNDYRSTTGKSLDNMKDWSVDEVELMRKWTEFLEIYGVFFSYPLDLDFMMLVNFKEDYISTAENSPRSNETHAAKIALGLGEDEFAKSYINNEFSLFPWYVYLFFRNVGKPKRHKLALGKITQREQWNNNLPSSLKRLVKEVKTLIHS